MTQFSQTCITSLRGIVGSSADQFETLKGWNEEFLDVVFHIKIVFRASFFFSVEL